MNHGQTGVIHLKDFPMSDVNLLEPYEINAFELEIKYLKSLDADRLLRGFCDIAGIKSDAPLYGGWETSAIQGHTLGHYLSAASRAYASCGDEEMKSICDYVISVLSRCQNKVSGYLAAIPENHYSKIEAGDTQETWVPWYSMHKLLSGIIDVHIFTENKKALSVASQLGDWVYSRTSRWNEEMQKTVLNVEYGGMNDCLYQLYSLTKNEKHLSAAHSFDEIALFEPIYNGNDILDGKHANTTIPKFLGALRRYIVLGKGEEFYLKAAESFWDMVVNHHTYITGGNSEWEHFGKPFVLDAERTSCNCETCNTYNMLKLSRELFKITRNKKYADYYENTFINAILSSQNPQTGMTTYFQPMATGFFKVYSSETNHFWCCTGSGMENFSKLNDSICFKDDNSIYIIRYTSSIIRWAEKKLTVTQRVEGESVKLSVSGSGEADIVLRVPDWCAGVPTVRINDSIYNAVGRDGFIRLSRKWCDGDLIELVLSMSVVPHRLPDNRNSVAFKYGPWVLSADLGNKNMATGVTGVNVTVPKYDSSAGDEIRIVEGTVEEWLEKIKENLVRQSNSLIFTLKGTDRLLTFTPHYMQHRSRYGIYFRFYDAI